MFSICIAVGPGETFGSLCRTLDSVANQTVGPVELVVKTVGAHLEEEIRSYVSQHPENIRLSLICGSDKGIYDAFNICAQAAHGDYALYLGCGDLLADRFVVEDLMQHAALHSNPDILYGSVLLADVDGEIVATFANDCFFGRKRQLPWRNPCHSQGLVYRSTWLAAHPFQIDIGPVADLVHTYQHSTFKHACWINRPISVFRAGGVSNERTNRAFKARLKGVYANCQYFRFPGLWRLVAGLACRIGYMRAK
jgi:hypothetical protein